MRKGGIGIILHPPIVSARLSPPSLGAFQSPFADLLSSLTLLLIWHAPIFIRHPSDLGSITCRQIVETTVLLVRGEIRISIWDSWGGCSGLTSIHLTSIQRAYNQQTICRDRNLHRFPRRSAIPRGRLD